MLKRKSYFKILLLASIIFFYLNLPATAQTPEPSGSPDTTGQPEPVFPSPLLGFHIGQGDSRHMEAVRAAGGRFAVVVFSWANIEPEPNYVYWELPDAALRAAEFYGIELIARLDQPPAWALDPDSEGIPWRLDAYANFARRVAERYGSRLAGVIVWNEPNLSLEWNDRPPNAGAYAEMLKATYPAIKSVAPDLPVLMAGLASTEGEGDWAINDLDYLQALYDAGVRDYFDIFTAHPYGFGRAPADPPEKFRPNFRRLELYRDIMIANGDSDKPVWVTELGWLTWTDNPKSEWQVITPEVQAEYILQAISYARENYPWLERLGFWQLNSAGDEYGFGIWQGPNQSSPAYDALAESCELHSNLCIVDPASPKSITRSLEAKIPVLAPDATIRLGDRGILHPHWVHLHGGGHNSSLDWQAEFFLTEDQLDREYDILLETMQVDQSTNQLFINDRLVGRLQPRSWPDSTSTWITQRLKVAPDILRPGLNRLSILVGLRNPARQYVGGRWENFQIRHIRLEPAFMLPEAVLAGWQSQPVPSGWSETNRLRPGLMNDLWLTGNRPGQLWRISPEAEAIERDTPTAFKRPKPKDITRSKKQDLDKPNSGVSEGEQSIAAGPLTPLTLEVQAGNRFDLIFNDILSGSDGELAATDQGLFWRARNHSDWQPVAGSPDSPAYVVAQANEQFYAGFEGEGLWRAATPPGPWERTALAEATVLDLVTMSYLPRDQSTPVDRLYAVTVTGIFVKQGLDTDWQAFPLPALSEEEMVKAGEGPGDKLRPRLYVTSENRLLVRNQDRLWLQSEQEPSGWRSFGPEKLRGKLYSVLNCCAPGALVGTNKAGLWQLSANGEWQRLDDGFFTITDITELFQHGDTIYAAGDLGLFQSQEGRTWQKAPDLPGTITDLIVDPAEPGRWLAGTPAGLYQSRDSGESWESISPPWIVWDLAVGPQGRIFAGHNNGIVWADDLSALPVRWQVGEGMERIYFLQVHPHPVEASIVWAGTWGNNIGASSDGGQSFNPLHNGLETLSGLDLIWHPTPGQVTLATFEGLYRTDDGGQSWFLLPGPLSRQTIYALLQTDDGLIWAGAADGLWLSRDYGVNWELANDLPQATVLRLGQLDLSPLISSLTPPIAEQSQRWLWAGTAESGLWLSQDSGASWQFGGLAGRAVYSLFFDPLQPGRLVAATDEGIFMVVVSEETILAMDQ